MYARRPGAQGGQGSLAQVPQTARTLFTRSSSHGVPHLRPHNRHLRFERRAFAVWKQNSIQSNFCVSVRARILLVDDIQIIRGSLRSLLTRESLEICGEAADGEEAIEKVRQLLPDIVILDIFMPVMNGIEAAQNIHRIAPSTKILFFTVEDIPQSAAIARSLGAHGFVAKDGAGRELISAIKDLLEQPVLPQITPSRSQNSQS
jgi:CheY-like chemotaxis protein